MGSLHFLASHEAHLWRGSHVASGSDFIADTGDRHFAGLFSHHVERLLGHRILYFTDDSENLEYLPVADAVVAADIDDQRAAGDIRHPALDLAHGLVPSGCRRAC